METLILDSNHPALNDFLEKPRRLKYDQFNDKWFKIEWTKEALDLKHKKMLDKKKLKYRENHPLKEKSKLSSYIKKKMGLMKSRINTTE